MHRVTTKKRANLIFIFLNIFFILSSNSLDFFLLSSFKLIILSSVKERYFIIELIIIENMVEYII